MPPVNFQLFVDRQFLVLAVRATIAPVVMALPKKLSYWTNRIVIVVPVVSKPTYFSNTSLRCVLPSAERSNMFALLSQGFRPGLHHAAPFGAVLWQMSVCMFSWCFRQSSVSP